MQQNNWYVITGGPGSGKSTTITLLKKRGLFTTTEAARDYFERQMALGFTIEQIRSDPQKLQNGIAEGYLEIERNLDPKQTVFLDRGIPDNFSYFEHYNLSVPPHLKKAYDECGYKAVFHLERLPLKNDHVRTENEEEVQKITDLGYAAYLDKKANIIHVPVMGKEARVDYILDYIKTHS